ncbi:MAG TPA: NADAR family protein [Puia sp.]|jgi:hypothetical protein
MIFNKNRLIQEYRDPENIPFLFFWGHQPSKDGSIIKSCFSQWWVAPFEVQGVTYQTAEHWMMAGKARLFGDEAAAEKIVAAVTPAAAKKDGRLVKDFVPEVWDKHKFGLVVAGNWHKFSQHAALKEFLLNTGEQVLVEASPMDKMWGIGMTGDHADARNPAKWQGENLLGFALMEVREKLKG